MLLCLTSTTLYQHMACCLGSALSASHLRPPFPALRHLLPTITLHSAAFALLPPHCCHRHIPNLDQQPTHTTGFSSSFLKSALPGFVSSSERLVELLGRKADSGEVVLMHHVAILTTLEIICKVVGLFG